MEKRFSIVKTLVAALLISGSASFVSCSKSDNPVSPGTEETTGSYITTIDDLVKAIQDAGAEATVIKLAPGINLTLNETIDLSGKQITILTPANSTAAHLVLGENGGFIVNNNFKLSNVTIDATASTTPLISLNAVNEQVTTIEAIDFENVSVTGLKKALFYSSAKDYLITNFNIVNSLVEQAGDATTIDFTKGSGAKTLTIENSTIWGNVPSTGTTTKSMYSSQGGQKLTEIEENSTQTFNIKNSTFYNLAKTKNFWSHRSSNQSWLVYNVENSVFVDCGKSGQVIKGLNGGQGGANPTWNISGNLFNFEGVNTGENEVTGDTNEPVKNSVEGIATITSTAEGLTVSMPSSVGDPRWLK